MLKRPFSNINRGLYLRYCFGNITVNAFGFDGNNVSEKDLITKYDNVTRCTIVRCYGFAYLKYTVTASDPSTAFIDGYPDFWEIEGVKIGSVVLVIVVLVTLGILFIQCWSKKMLKKEIESELDVKKSFKKVCDDLYI